MQIGMFGLGRMGANIARRLLRHGHDVAVHDLAPTAMDEVARDGASPVKTFEDLIAALKPPRTVWVMLPVGESTETAITRLAGLLAVDDAVIDGGNTFWRDNLRHAAALKESGLHHLDIGTSGGLFGRNNGYCLLIGDEAAIVRRLEPTLAYLAPGADIMKTSPVTQGWLHVGPHGAGHFVNMVHNGIEYALMQAYAEGFQILKEAHSEALAADERFARCESNFADKMISAMCHGFGGHAEAKGKS